MTDILSSPLTIGQCYGYVILVGVACCLFPFYLMGKVVAARKKYDVKYPALYSDTSVPFNCIQRAHQNFLETFPIHMIFLFVGGLSCPCGASIGGIIYLAGRFAYSKGYSTGIPENRKKGTFGVVGSLILLLCTLNTAYKLISYSV